MAGNMKCYSRNTSLNIKMVLNHHPDTPITAGMAVVFDTASDSTLQGSVVGVDYHEKDVILTIGNIDTDCPLVTNAIIHAEDIIGVELKSNILHVLWKE